MEHIILWGAGDYCKKQLYKYYIPLDIIDAIVDIDTNIQGKELFGKTIISQDQVKNYKAKIILISSIKYFDEISRMVEDLDLDKKAYFLDDYLDDFFVCKGTRTTLGCSDLRNNNQINARLEHAGSILPEKLKNAKVLASRHEAVKLLPKGGIVAEVGVAYGDFSDCILEQMRPKHFYAIDIFFPYSDVRFWGRDDFQKANLTHEEWYREKYRDIIPEKMTICKGLSWECLGKFDDEFFDYIYIDASHAYEDVYRDLTQAIKKIKKGGYIQLNDYTLWDVRLEEYYGVIPATNEMINSNNLELAYLCLENKGFYDVVLKKLF